MAQRTYKTAHDEIMIALTSLGWKVENSLKFPHATSPNGHWRLWFKPQSIYFMISPLGHFAMGNARSIDQLRYFDVRTETPNETIERIVQCLEKWDK